MPELTTIGFDADDTLWHHEKYFVSTKAAFVDLLAPFAERALLDTQLHDTEIHNVLHYGFGVKSFTLSMVETAIELSGGNIPARELQEVIALGKELLGHPVELIDGVADTLDELSRDHTLVLVTKGDLLHQETKLAASGLGELFWRIEIVSEKDVPTYERILRRHEIAPTDFVMVGNSVRSDILPVLAVGGHAIHIEYEYTWEHELVEHAEDVATATSILDVPELVR